MKNHPYSHVVVDVLIDTVLSYEVAKAFYHKYMNVGYLSKHYPSDSMINFTWDENKKYVFVLEKIHDKSGEVYYSWEITPVLYQTKSSSVLIGSQQCEP